MTRDEARLYVDCIREHEGCRVGDIDTERLIGSVLLLNKDYGIAVAVSRYRDEYTVQLIIDGDNQVIIRTHSQSLFQFFQSEVQRLVAIGNQQTNSNG